jgi:hypothetical protein
MDLIDLYVEYGKESTDAPVIYHKALGYFVVSSLLGRFVKIITSYSPTGLAPNLWILLIGPSRIARKTTAMRLAVNVVKSVEPALVMPASFTPEALYEMFNNMNPGDAVVWVKDELGGFFKSLEKKYMYGVREILSSIYTGHGEVRKLRNLTLRIPDNLYVTAVGTMPTPPHEYLSEEDFEGGFMNRWILAYAIRREYRLPLLHQSVRADALFKEIVQTIKDYENTLLSITPVISPTKAAIDKLEEYDREVDHQLELMEQTSPGSLFKMYFAETPTLLMKMSVLRRLARGDYDPSGIITIDIDDVVKALDDLRIFIDGAKQVIDDVQSSPRAKPVVTEEKALERIMGYISSKKEQGATYSELLLKTRIFSKDLKEYLLTLMEQDRIICVRSSSHMRGRPSLRFYDSAYRNLALTHGEQVTIDMLKALLR